MPARRFEHFLLPRRHGLASIVLALVVAFGALGLWSSGFLTRADATGGCAPVTVAAENALPGGTGWRPSRHVGTALVQGFADRTSVTCGSIIRVSLGARTRVGVGPARIEAWRLGYYGGSGGRLVWTSPVVAVRRPARWAAIDRSTRMVTAPWPVSLEIPVTGDWPQGVYVLRIVPQRHPQSGGEIPLVVRDPLRTSTYVHVLAVNTWQMYSAWGGAGAYSATPSTVVSFDRPYAEGYPRTMFNDDYPLIRFEERLGLDVGYATDVDLNAGGPQFDAATALVFGSHTEYWTTAMRAHLVQALRAKVNAVFFGANNIYWRPVPVGGAGAYRELAIYRFASVDPFGSDPNRGSERWRDAPIRQPEQQIIGEQYGCVGVLEPMHVPRRRLGWMFANTGAHPGERLPGVDYYETDVPNLAYPEPQVTQVVTETRFACPRRDIALSGSAVTVSADAGASGSLVVDLGTRGWVCLLNASCTTAAPLRWGKWVGRVGSPIVPTRRNLGYVRAIVERATRNILRVVGAGPAGWVTVADPYPAVGPSTGAGSLDPGVTPD